MDYWMWKKTFYLLQVFSWLIFKWVLPTYDVDHPPGIIGGACMCMASFLRDNVTFSVTV